MIYEVRICKIRRIRRYYVFTLLDALNLKLNKVLLTL